MNTEINNNGENANQEQSAEAGIVASQERVQNAAPGQAGFKIDGPSLPVFELARNGVDAGLKDLENYNELAIASWLVDIESGHARTVELLSTRAINVEKVTRALADSTARSIACEFFSGRYLRAVVVRLIPTVQFIVGESPFVRDNVIEAIDAIVDDLAAKRYPRASASAVSAARVSIASIVLPDFVKNGLVGGESTPILMREFRPVTRIAELGSTIEERVREDIADAIVSCQAKWQLNTKARYGREHLGVHIADAYYPLGQRLRISYDYAVLVECIVRCIAWNIEGIHKYATGGISRTIASHDVVTELSMCGNFVTAAIEWLKTARAQGNGVAAYQLPLSDADFRAFAPLFLASLKRSGRYKLVPKADLLQHISTHHVIDLRNQRRGTLLVEHNRMAARSLAINPVAAYGLSGAVTIEGVDGRIDNLIASGYGSSPSELSSENLAKQLFAVWQHVVQNDSDNDDSVELRIASVFDITPEFVASNIATRVLYNFEDLEQPVIYQVKTDYTPYAGLKSGFVEAGYAYTTDPVEVIVCHTELVASSDVPQPPQLLPANAIGAYMYLDPKLDLIVDPTEKLVINSNVSGVLLRATVHWNHFTFARHNETARLVYPVYNGQVFDLAHRMVGEMVYMAEHLAPASDKALRRRLKQICVMTIFQIARSVDRNWRAMVREHVRKLARSKMSMDEQRALDVGFRSAGVSHFMDLLSSAYFFACVGFLNVSDVRNYAQEVDGPKTTRQLVANPGPVVANTAMAKSMFAYVYNDGDALAFLNALATDLS